MAAGQQIRRLHSCRQKSAKKLLGLLRFDRHKRIRKTISSTKTKTEFGAGISTYCRLRRHYILRLQFLKKKEKLDLYGQDSGGDPRQATEMVPTKKKKYKINSYLFNVVCKFPRKYASNFLGKEIMRTYYTIPSKLSMTRFLAGKVLKQHYRNLSTNTFDNLAKSVQKRKAMSP